MLFIDEYSMVSHTDLMRIDIRLKQIRQNKLKFGGLHVVLVGDPVQLPPVMASALYRPPSPTSSNFSLAQGGYGLFLDFTSVTTLVEVRDPLSPFLLLAISDASFARTCERRRTPHTSPCSLLSELATPTSRMSISRS